MESRVKIEWTIIYIISLMLVVSLCSLTSNVVAASGTEKYPNLYAPVPSGDISDAGAAEMEKTIYLTFDDGPSKNTEKVLDVLKEEGVKASFFVTAQAEDKEYASALLKRIIDEGHVIGLHSYTHDFEKIYKSMDSYLSDIDRLNNFIIESAGYRPSILRFPGGSRTMHCKRGIMDEIIKEIERRGYVYFDWNVVSGDETATIYPAEQLSGNITKGVKPPNSSIILAHDNPSAKTTAEAVRISVKELRSKGYSFESLTPQVKPVHIK